MDWETGYRVYVASVPHTGVTWLLRLLKDGFGIVNNFPKVKGVRHAHLTPDAPDECWESVERWIAEGWPVIIPLRDPALVAASCLNRGSSDHTAAFKRIAGWRDEPNVFFFHTDRTTGKNAQVVALASFLGLPTPRNIDWSPANEFPDRLGLKAALARGDSPAELRRAASLRDDPDVASLYGGGRNGL